jgi:subtilisin family serine protease
MDWLIKNFFMKNNLKSSVCSIIILYIFTISSVSSCKCNKDKYNFYYSGETKVEITISRDTLGILLKDTILSPAYNVKTSLDKINNLADSNLQNSGYSPAGFLENDKYIKLIVSPKKNISRSSREKEARQLKGSKNKSFASNAGYLAHINGTNKAIIVTDEIIVRFNPGTTDTIAKALLYSYKLAIVRKNSFTGIQYTVSTTKDSPHDALRMAQLLKDNQIVKFAQINFIYAKEFLSAKPNDALFERQWNLLNNGTDALEDADIDADLAWDLSMGSNNTTIAVIDLGFDVNHFDLAGNFSHNSSEISGNGVDDDNNGYVDDFIGWNFNGNNNNLDGGEHGTAVIGVANAIGNNDAGIIGSCPKCNSIPIRSGHTPEADQLAIEYAKKRDAKIINCSWEYGMLAPDNVVLAIKEVVSAGIVVVCAMTNENAEYCRRTSNLVDSVPDLIFVSRSTSMDTYDGSGWGDCMTLLAPTGVDGSPPGLLKLTTTDIMGVMGYNDGKNDQLGCAALSNPDFTGCFWGTSASAPLTAGVAGLILSANSSLTPQQIKYLLQDCADKIENTIAKYSPVNGKSTIGTHGYGRLNAYEAVKIASPLTDIGGRNGVDIFLRDNDLDWGNTEQPSNTLFEGNPRGFIPHWRSPDIKVDAPDISNHFETPTNSGEFESFTDESPIGDKINKVYVRVRNRGYKTASNVSVKLYWVYAGAMLPALWPDFPQDLNGDLTWRFLGTQTISSLPYSGSSIAVSADDPAQIVTFDFNAPIPDPSLPNHYCLLAMVSCDDDPLVTNGNSNLDMVTPYFNNITHRNYAIETPSSSAMRILFLYNPLNIPVQTKVTVINPKNIVVKDANINFDTLFTLKAREKRLVKFSINNSQITYPSELTIQQEIILNYTKKRRVIGGFTYYFRR